MPKIHTIGPVEVWIYFNDTQKHRRPHFHAVTVDEQIVLAIPTLAVLAGSLEGRTRLYGAALAHPADELPPRRDNAARCA